MRPVLGNTRPFLVQLKFGKAVKNAMSFVFFWANDKLTLLTNILLVGKKEKMSGEMSNERSNEMTCKSHLFTISSLLLQFQ